MEVSSLEIAPESESGKFRVKIDALATSDELESILGQLIGADKE